MVRLLSEGCRLTDVFLSLEHSINTVAVFEKSATLLFLEILRPYHKHGFCEGTDWRNTIFFIVSSNNYCNCAPLVWSFQVIILQ